MSLGWVVLIFDKQLGDGGVMGGVKLKRNCCGRGVDGCDDKGMGLCVGVCGYGESIQFCFMVEFYGSYEFVQYGEIDLL